MLFVKVGKMLSKFCGGWKDGKKMDMVYWKKKDYLCVW